MNRTLRALAAALAATLVVAGPALADATVPDSVTVPASLTIQGLPASIDYGTTLPGDISATRTYNLTINSNVDGWAITINGSALTRSGGSETIAANMRMASINGGPLTNFPNFSGGAPKLTGNAGTTTATVGFAVAIPASTKAGTYTGSLTFVVTLP